MPIAIDTTQTSEYVLRSERQEDGSPRQDATVFILRPITSREFARCMQVKEINGSGAAPIQCVRHGLAGVRGFRDGKGAVVDLATRKGLLGVEVTDAFMDRLAMSWVIELSDEITRLNQISEGEEKNS